MFAHRRLDERAHNEQPEAEQQLEVQAGREDQPDLARTGVRPRAIEAAERLARA
jgi:hypothetical protein